MKTVIKYSVMILAMYLFSSTFLLAQNIESIVKAYELRMDGNIEAAKNTLNEIIKIDSTNALAYFEMARTVENDRNIFYIEKAIAFDNDNIMYLFYKANLEMLNAYKAMKTNKTETISKNLNQCIETLTTILTKKPDCKESLLFLVEIYGYLPEDVGGNKAKATEYLKKLEPLDPFYAAQGLWVLESSSNSADIVAFWENYISTNGKNQEALIKLGKAHLLKNEIKQADKLFDGIIKSDPSKIVLKLEVARAYLYKAMRGIDNQSKMLEGFKTNINYYLESNEDKPKLIEAWCYGWLGTIEGRQGNKTLSETYHNKAKALIPNYPRFTAIPKIDNPPDINTYIYSSYFSPF